MTVAQGKLIPPSTPNSVFTSPATIYALSAWSHIIWSVSGQNGVIVFIVSLFLNVTSSTTSQFHFCHSFHPSSFLACQTTLQTHQTCFPAEVTAAELTARFCSISQENFGNSLTLNSRADVAALTGGMCCREIPGCFHAGADTDKGTGSFLFSSLTKKNFTSLFFSSTNCCLISEVAREIKVSSKGGIQSTDMQLK